MSKVDLVLKCFSKIVQKIECNHGIEFGTIVLLAWWYLLFHLILHCVQHGFTPVESDAEKCPSQFMARLIACSICFAK